MELAEPITMITDYLITVYTFILAVLILQQFSYTTDPGQIYLAIVLIITGLGALFGGSAHGFKLMMSKTQHQLIWRLTTYSIGIAAFFFVITAAVSSIQNSVARQVLMVVALVQLIGYMWWMIDHDEFLYVIINYMVSMIIVIILKVYSLLVFDDPSSWWIIGGILVSILASTIQALGIGIHEKYFNHNDLFHVVQLPGFYLLYRAALVLTNYV